MIRRQLTKILGAIILSSAFQISEVSTQEFSATAPLSVSLGQEQLKRQLFDLIRQTWTFSPDSTDNWPFFSNIVNIVTPFGQSNYLASNLEMTESPKERKLSLNLTDLKLEVEAMTKDEINTVYSMRAIISSINTSFGIG